MKKFAIILMILSLVSCGNDSEKDENQDGKKANLEDMRWVEGTWKDESTFGFKVPPKYLMETWVSYPDSLSGYGFSVQGTDTVITELITIMMVNDKLTYIARPSGQSMVSFTIIENGSNHYVFENKANDFPQKLTYKKVGSDSSIVQLDGVHNTMQHSIQFKYKKN